MKHNAPNKADVYKTSHREQYPEGTSLVFSNFTPRSSKHCNVPTDRIVWFGMQYFIKHHLLEEWGEFFNSDKSRVIERYRRRVSGIVGKQIDCSHFESLHDLGYLPIEICALPEGSEVPFGIPCMVIFNTKPEFFWLTNYLETILSSYLWMPCTSATTARSYRKICDKYAEITGADKSFVQFQGHDFSMRGMPGPQAAMMSGAGHLLSFSGTDTIPAIDFLEDYYDANSDAELVGCSVPASEHSVMSAGGCDNEFETFRRFITEIYPSGIVSIVSDTWDYWTVITDFAPRLKSEILNRDGKVVFRPDSGDPVKIICGDPEAPDGSPERKGSVQCLWETFGGTTNAKGYKSLNPKVGLIYGDSITYKRANDILNILASKGFETTCVVFGIGSYTYQCVTRDVLGFAVKATYCEINGISRNIFKNPKTDDGMKKSAKGILYVGHSSHGYFMEQEVTWDRFRSDSNQLQTVFKDGLMLKSYTLKNIRARLNNP